MGESGAKGYWRIGPVYVRRGLFLLAVSAASAAVLAVFGLPLGMLRPPDGQIPAYRYDDDRLLGISGVVRVLDSAGHVRYEGEVELGECTGRGMVFDGDGQLVYDGPLADGMYEGPDAKVYRAGVLVYAGEMAGGLYEGQGRRVDPDTGVTSEGEFVQGALEGRGRELSADGALLREGMFSQDRLEGEGMEYGRDGVLLREGGFSAGLLHGEGREYTAGGALRYEGQFRRGVYHGQGALYDTLLGVPLYRGAFMDGKPMGTGSIYHPSGQLLYTGQVYGASPRADAFLGLSLVEVETAFSTHWLLYSCGGVTAFVYPYFHLMFVTESPVGLVSPEEQAGIQATGGPAMAGETAGGEVLDPGTDKAAVIITQVLSYGQGLSGAAQPDPDGPATGRHAAGWREWFSSYAMGEGLENALARQTGVLVVRFSASGQEGEMVEEFGAPGAGVETMSVWRGGKETGLWYQTARWTQEP